MFCIGEVIYFESIFKKQSKIRIIKRRCKHTQNNCHYLYFHDFRAYKGKIRQETMHFLLRGRNLAEIFWKIWRPDTQKASGRKQNGRLMGKQTSRHFFNEQFKKKRFKIHAKSTPYRLINTIYQKMRKKN